MKMRLVCVIAHTFFTEFVFITACTTQNEKKNLVFILHTSAHFHKIKRIFVAACAGTLYVGISSSAHSVQQYNTTISPILPTMEYYGFSSSLVRFHYYTNTYIFRVFEAVVVHSW